MKLSRSLYWVLLALFLTIFPFLARETESSQVLLVVFKPDVSEQRIDDINDRIGVIVLQIEIDNTYYVLPPRNKKVREVMREYQSLPEVDIVSVGRLPEY